MAEEDDIKEYRWETGYEKTWEAIKEDEEGNLDASVQEIIQKAKRKAQSERKGATRLGMMRHVYVVLDASEAMLDQDLKPTRQLCTLKLMEGFVDEFLYENPLSQLGFILTRNKRAEKISDLSGNVKKHIEALKANFSQPSALSGEPSLQNALEMALSSLRNMPSHASREVLIVVGSLTTCDPSDINFTIDALEKASVRVSVIGIGAEVRLCAYLCRKTGGVYSILLDDVHLKHLLHEATLPPPSAATSQDSALVKMGFPHHGAPASATATAAAASGGAVQPSGQTKARTTLAICMCHLDSDNEVRLESGGYLCPQCRSKYCELPVECNVCALTLVSAPHLARSYHHLFPVKPYTQVDLTPQFLASHTTCFACLHVFDKIQKHAYLCETCSKYFCMDCDIFVHDTLHTCPGCTTNQKTYQSISDK